MFFVKNITTYNLYNANWGIVWATLNHPVVIELFSEIVVKCEVKLYKDVSACTLKVNCQDVY